MLGLTVGVGVDVKAGDNVALGVEVDTRLWSTGGPVRGFGGRPWGRGLLLCNNITIEAAAVQLSSPSPACGSGLLLFLLTASLLAGFSFPAASLGLLHIRGLDDSELFPDAVLTFTLRFFRLPVTITRSGRR